MQMNWSAEDESFREQLRAFLAEHDPGKPPKGATERLTFQKAWAATITSTVDRAVWVRT